MHALGESIAGGSKGGVLGLALLLSSTRWSRKAGLSQKVTLDRALKEGRGV